MTPFSDNFLSVSFQHSGDAVSPVGASLSARPGFHREQKSRGGFSVGASEPASKEKRQQRRLASPSTSESASAGEPPGPGTRRQPSPRQTHLQLQPSLLRQAERFSELAERHGGQGRGFSFSSHPRPCRPNVSAGTHSLSPMRLPGLQRGSESFLRTLTLPAALRGVVPSQRLSFIGMIKSISCGGLRNRTGPLQINQTVLHGTISQLSRVQMRPE